MIIQESDFIMEGDEGSFNLRFLITKKKKDGTTVEEFGKTIYGCSLYSAMDRIIRYRIKNKNQTGAIEMRKYKDDLITEMKFLHNIFDGNKEEDNDGLD